jgi:6-phosphogluconolactonase
MGAGALTGGNNDGRPVLYAMTNRSAGNSVVAWRVNPSGTLEPLNTYPTGGNGSQTEVPLAAGPVDGIDPLGSQGSLSLSEDKQYLFAVNAGSNPISVFRVGTDGSLSRTDIASTGGTNPVSACSRHDRLYVANVNDPAGGQPARITGFKVNTDGTLTQIAGATHALSGAMSRPAQIGLTPDGTSVIVTEQGTDTVSAFPVNADNTLGSPMATASPRPAPFGFDFGAGGQLIVSEAAPNSPNGSSTSSYQLGGGAPQVLKGGVLNGQKARCWVKVSSLGPSGLCLKYRHEHNNELRHCR